MPYFSNIPFGGWWYTNNVITQEENYLFLEVLAVINSAMGNKVTTEVSKRSLVGHSMGGYGAIMNSMRTDMQYFGSTCGFSGGLYIWNLPQFQDKVRDTVIEEAVARKSGPFVNCSYTQLPYRYYADEINFNTIIATSLATVFHSDGTTKPTPNMPYFSASLFNPDCTRYVQLAGFRFWLNENGTEDKTLFSVAPWNSPEGFLELAYPSLQKSLSGNIFISATYEDEIVDYLENQLFSESLTSYNISHVFYSYNGSHRDPFPGVTQCFKTFHQRLCAAVPPPGPGPDVTIGKAAFWAIVGIGLALLVVVVIFIISWVVGRGHKGYDQIVDK
jgi:hypothetical protein